MTLKDNYFATGEAGGDRIGFDEIRFLTTLATDQRGDGFDRMVDGKRDGTIRVDVGAYEHRLIFIVDAFGDVDDGNESAGNLTLREAVRMANTTAGADTIAFDTTVFSAGDVILLTSQLNVSESVTISGPGADYLAINGNDVTRIFNLGGSGANTYTFENLTLVDGNAGTSTGGAINLGDVDDTLIVDRVEFLSNASNGGGAIFVAGSDYLIKNSSFVQNHANFNGSAVLAFGDAQGFIYNTTISGNTTNGTGGALFAQTAGTDFALMQLRNVTVVDNQGKGIEASGSAGSFALIEIANSIVADNGAINALAGGDSDILSFGFNISDDTSPVFDSPDDLISTDPLLGVIDYYGGPTLTHALSTNSPAIDAGSNSLEFDESISSIPLDQRGEFYDRITDGDGDLTATVDIGAFERQIPKVVGTHVYYNDSSFSGSGASGAIAPDKSLLREGETATFANYTSYIHGINGLVVDVIGDASNIGADDFEFKFGNVDDVGTWATITPNVIVTLIGGGGVNGSNRVVLEFDNGAIAGGWLQIRMLANADTGLPADDVFYVGNAIGETGNSTADARVDLEDLGLTRVNQTGFGSTDILSVYDINRDTRVDLVDVGLIRVNQSGFTLLKLITPTNGSNRSGSANKGGGGQGSGGQGFAGNGNDAAQNNDGEEQFAAGNKVENGNSILNDQAAESELGSTALTQASTISLTLDQNPLGQKVENQLQQPQAVSKPAPSDTQKESIDSMLFGLPVQDDSHEKISAKINESIETQLAAPVDHRANEPDNVVGQTADASVQPNVDLVKSFTRTIQSEPADIEANLAMTDAANSLTMVSLIGDVATTSKYASHPVTERLQSPISNDQRRESLVLRGKAEHSASQVVLGITSLDDLFEQFDPTVRQDETPQLDGFDTLFEDDLAFEF